jgi:hypothetical protein
MRKFSFVDETCGQTWPINYMLCTSYIEGICMPSSNNLWEWLYLMSEGKGGFTLVILERPSRINHPKWIHWMNQISFTLFSNIEQDNLFQNCGNWIRAFRSQCCVWLFNQWMQKNCWEKKAFVGTEVRGIKAKQEWMCLFEPKQFRHINVVWARTTFHWFITLVNSAAYLVRIVWYSILLPLRRISKNSAPAQFSVVHLHELFCFYSVQILCSTCTQQSFIKSSTTGVWSSWNMVGYLEKEQRNNQTPNRKSTRCSLRRNM